MSYTSQICLFTSLLLVGCGDDATMGDPPDMAFVLPHRDGALIDVTMQSRVGVLLDELPAAQRDAAAAATMAQPEAFWKARASSQLELTTYRLVFRNAFYNGKGQLPPPPKEVWKFELDTGGPKRVMIDGHDLVVIDYTYSSTLVTDIDSPAKSDAVLADVGGEWSEPFYLPVDPELLLQRTGYACMDESEFPPNSVDGENVSTFYDWQCTTGQGCHLTQQATENCVDALTNHVGRVQAEMIFTRVAWDDTKADAARTGKVTNATGADLEVLGEGLDNHRIIYRYIPADSCAVAESCVGGSGWRRLLQFDASVRNVGPAALNIGKVDYLLDGADTPLSDHHIFEFSPCHMHYHFTHYGDFSFGDHKGDKRAFCLQSTQRYSNNEYSPLTNDYGSCAYQGIEAGWGDDYGAGLDCQWIDITDVDTSAGPVTQSLSFVSNKDQFLCEGTQILDASGDPTFVPTPFTTAKGEPVDRFACDFLPAWDGNNTQARDVTVPKDGGLITAPCSRGQLGPRRDCGFAEQKDAPSLLTCTPGAAVTLSCQTASGAPQVLRVCERSKALAAGTACVYRDALANGIVTPTATMLSLTCPAARDATETGGALSLYAAPVLPSDTAQLVSCTLL